MKNEEILVSQKTPIISNEESEVFGFGYGTATENATISKGGGGGGCCCCCCGGVADLDD